MTAVAEQLKNLTKQEFLFWCASQIGTTESPAGSNRVPYWLNTKPEWNGAAWCAAFLQSGALKGGEDMRDDFGWGPYYVPQIVADAKAAGQWVLVPQAGDWVVMGNTGYSHIGVVEAVIQTGHAGTSSLIIQSIEGNTSPTNAGSQNNGDGVYRKIRSGAFVKGFVRVKYAPPAPASSIPPALSTPKPTTRWTRADVKVLQTVLRTTPDGSWGAGTQTRAQALRAVAASSVGHNTAQVKLVQGMCNLRQDGLLGPKTRAAVAVKVKAVQKILRLTQDGNWGPGTDRTYVAFHKEWRGK